MEGIFVISSDILGITSDQVTQLALLDREVMVISLVGLFALLYTTHVLLGKNTSFKGFADRS
jgi:hypothetical protein